MEEEPKVVLKKIGHGVFSLIVYLVIGFQISFNIFVGLGLYYRPTFSEAEQQTQRKAPYIKDRELIFDQIKSNKELNEKLLSILSKIEEKMK